jgi:hypothetical protein
VAVARHLTAVSLIRAAIADDPDSRILIMSQHGGCLPNTRSHGSSQIRASVRTSMSNASDGRPGIWRRTGSSSSMPLPTRPRAASSASW